MKALNIEYDIDLDDLEDGELEDIEASLPTEIEIPNEVKEKLKANEDAVSDYISDLTGYCVLGYDLE